MAACPGRECAALGGFLILKWQTCPPETVPRRPVAPASQVSGPRCRWRRWCCSAAASATSSAKASVEGNARVDLSFPVQDINDLLKSMVLRDLDGGHISAVSYDCNAPVERTLKSFAINLTGNPAFGAILNQARGEKVEVVLQQANATQPGTMSGTVVGVEKQKQQSARKDRSRSRV